LIETDYIPAARIALIETNYIPAARMALIELSVCAWPIDSSFSPLTDYIPAARMALIELTFFLPRLRTLWTAGGEASCPKLNE
jgi:hypothetical protein